MFWLNCGRNTGEVRWNLTEFDVPIMEYLLRENAIEMHDIRELRMGWAWVVNDLRVFPSCMARYGTCPSFSKWTRDSDDSERPSKLIQVEKEMAEMALSLHPYERPLAASPPSIPQNLAVGRDSCYEHWHKASQGSSKNLDSEWSRNADFPSLIKDACEEHHGLSNIPFFARDHWTRKPLKKMRRSQKINHKF